MCSSYLLVSLAVFFLVDGIILNIALANNEEAKLSFEENIIASLKGNVFGQCQWEIMHADEPADNVKKSDILVSPQYPSQKEIAAFAAIPRTLSKTNKDLAIGMMKVRSYVV
jgi:hypothetical protein